ncbi:MAG: 50S ribosomal protein L28 [Helicobacteraceae bacterium]|jgi:large subunit ribosomal protein L28|nr:50S ribosomal protein L28 [Helicobacteraceae bacterium]
MSKKCSITGKSHLIGNKVSHANNKKKRVFGVNLRMARISLEDGSTRKIRVAASTLRTLRKTPK